MMPSDPSERYGNTNKLLSDDDIAEVRAAFDAFYDKKKDFDDAADNADRTVELTLAWVGVGEKLVGLVETVLQQRAGAAPATDQPRFTAARDRLNQLRDLSKLLQGDLRDLV